MQNARKTPGASLSVTVQVLDGVDKGKVFRDLPVPLTIGREEGNQLRLNDERVSRFHAKVQQDGDDLILTDLVSTNGTRVNGRVVQIRRLRYGDRITVGRSLLLFGSDDEINARRVAMLQSRALEGTLENSEQGPPTVHASAVTSGLEEVCDFDLNIKQDVTSNEGELFIGKEQLPALPQKLSPSQSARLAEILDFLHHHLTKSTDNIEANEEGTQITLSYEDWQGVLAVQKLLAQYLRAIAEPDTFEA
jgi:pSer/pThr/pTyr-binding forkhead associated (FHA) protein